MRRETPSLTVVPRRNSTYSPLGARRRWALKVVGGATMPRAVHLLLAFPLDTHTPPCKIYDIYIWIVCVFRGGVCKNKGNAWTHGPVGPGEVRCIRKVPLTIPLWGA